VKKALSIIMAMCTHLFANTEYNLNYKLVSDTQNIGRMNVVCTNNQNIYTYTSSVNIKFKYLFSSHTYTYKEIAKVKEGKILSLEIYEDDDGKVSQTKATRDKSHLIYEDGKSVDLGEIDYLPFDIRAKGLTKYLQDKNFKLITFDPQSAQKVFEKYTLSNKTNQSFSYEVLTNDELEIKTFNQDNILIYAKNKWFETVLLNSPQ